MTTTSIELESFSDLPKGCFTHPVRDNKHWPLLQVGDFAVVDGNDTEYVSGQLYLIKYEPTDCRDPYCHIWQVNDARGTKEPCVDFSPTNRPPKDVDFVEWIHNGGSLYMSDGPLKIKHLPEYMQGRVIGVLASASTAGRRAAS